MTNWKYINAPFRLSANPNSWYHCCSLANLRWRYGANIQPITIYCYTIMIAGSPVLTSNLEPCQWHSTSYPSSVPSARGLPSCGNTAKCSARSWLNCQQKTWNSSSIVDCTIKKLLSGGKKRSRILLVCTSFLLETKMTNHTAQEVAEELSSLASGCLYSFSLVACGPTWGRVMPIFILLLDYGNEPYKLEGLRIIQTPLLTLEN